MSDAPRGGAWIVAATVLGSGAVFLESTVANVALPAIGRHFQLDIAGLQWVMSGYLVTLSALMLLGGALGDRFRRSTVFAVGLLGFSAATLCCALAPRVEVLLACRVVQGAAGALAVPNSLALLETTFHGEARGAAIGRWAAWSAVSTAVGPPLGGWLVDVGSWRWVFAGVVPVALAAGAAMLPVNALMLAISPRVGRLAERIGHRAPIAAGALVAGAGMTLFARVRPGGSYATAVLPAVLVFGLGLSVFVAPISAAALRAAPDRDAGVASAVNNAVSRLGGLLATVLLPLLAGIGALRDPRGPALTAGFARAMWICAGLCAAGAATALVTIPAAPGRDRRRTVTTSRERTS